MNVLIGVGIALQYLATSTINLTHTSGPTSTKTMCLQPAWANCSLMSMYGPLARLIPIIDTKLRENCCDGNILPAFGKNDLFQSELPLRRTSSIPGPDQGQY